MSAGANEKGASSRIEVVPVPCLLDNYAYLVCDREAGVCAVVDPSEAAPVISAIEREKLTLAGVWCTHHHMDHVGGVVDLLGHYGDKTPVYGHASERERIPRLSRPLEDGQCFDLGGALVCALHVPAHTTGALAFAVSPGDAHEQPFAAFTGDTLFAAGCGRLFEGTPAMMFRALDAVLGALPASCALYPGHEYAEKNLRFAATVEPANVRVTERLSEVSARRARGEACVPSTVALERETNPFMRARKEGVRAFARARGADAGDPAAVLGAVRSARDVF